MQWVIGLLSEAGDNQKPQTISPAGLVQVIAALDVRPVSRSSTRNNAKSDKNDSKILANN